MKPDFWDRKSVLITGHTGFKGSWLCLWLQCLGAEVIGYSLSPPTDPNMFEIARVANGMTSVEGDVRDVEHIKQILAEYRPEVVIHLAAQSLVRQSYVDPVETYSTNVMGTVNVLEAVRGSKHVRVVVNVTSDKCYENKEWIWGYRESDPVGGHDPYSSSKGCAEIITSAYVRSFLQNDGVIVASARGGNVVGGGDWSRERLIPDIVLAILNGKPALIRNPEAVRPWQYVLDPLNGYLTLAEKMWGHGRDFQGGWNFGPDSSGSKSVSWIADRIASQWSEAGWTSDVAQNPHEAQILKLDSTKAKDLLGWSPTLDVTDAIDWTVSWYKAYAGKKEDMHELSKTEIARFQDLL